MECPVCNSEVNDHRHGDRGERLHIDCPRCGLYEISRTAIGMVRSRVKDNPINAAKLSHALRTALRKESEWPLVSSANLDEFMALPLPSMREQTQLLVSWIAHALGEDTLGSIDLPKLDHLAGVVGVIDGNRVGKLIAHAHKNGYLGDGLNSLSLTPEGWELVSSPSEDRTNSTTSIMQADSTTEIKCHCDICGGEKNSIVRGEFKIHGSEDFINWSNSYFIVQCKGCDHVSFRHESWFSEHDDYGYDPVTGEEIVIPGIKVNTWPPPSVREMPGWVDTIQDDSLRALFKETYSSLDHNNFILAMIGARTLLDCMMIHAVGDVGNFQDKIKAMIDAGKLGNDEKDKVITLVDVGSASAHRGFKPKLTTMIDVLSAVEAMVYREYILPTAAAKVKEITPPRKKSREKP